MCKKHIYTSPSIYENASIGLGIQRKHVYGHAFTLTVPLRPSYTRIYTPTYIRALKGWNQNEVRYLWKQSRICCSAWYEVELASTPHRYLSKSFQHIVGTLR